MPNTNELSKAPFPKPVELMIADAFLVRLNMRKNHILFRDLSERDTRYSFWQYDSPLDHRKSILDFHKTIQTHGNPRIQIPIFKKEYDNSHGKNSSRTYGLTVILFFKEPQLKTLNGKTLRLNSCLFKCLSSL